MGCILALYRSAGAEYRPTCSPPSSVTTAVAGHRTGRRPVHRRRARPSGRRSSGTGDCGTRRSRTLVDGRGGAGRRRRARVVLVRSRSLIDRAAMDLRRARLLVAYDGAPFRGFAVNVGVRSVMGDLTDAISLIVRQPVRTDGGRAHRRRRPCVGSGGLRRSAGRHRSRRAGAPGQQAVCAVDRRASRRVDDRRLRRPVLGPVAPVPLRGVERSRLRTRLRAGRAWWVPQPLALWAMNAACDPADRRARLRLVLSSAQGGRGPTGADVGAPSACPHVGATWTVTVRCCGSRSGPTPSVTRWSARSSARWSTSGWARLSPGDVRPILMTARPGSRRPGGPARRPGPLGGRLPARRHEG